MPYDMCHRHTAPWHHIINQAAVILLQDPAACVSLFFQIIQLSLQINQSMLQIKDLLVSGCYSIFQYLRLLLRLEVIIGDVKLYQNALHLIGLTLIALQLLNLSQLIVQLITNLLNIFFAFITTDHKDLTINDHLCLVFR